MGTTGGGGSKIEILKNPRTRKSSGLVHKVPRQRHERRPHQKTGIQCPQRQVNRSSTTAYGETIHRRVQLRKQT